MKKLFIIVALLVFVETLYGQGFQVGLRTGGGALFTLNNKLEEYTQATWNSQLYTRYESKKWFAMEIGLYHSNYKVGYVPEPMIQFEEFAYSSVETIHTTEKVNSVAFNISLQSKIAGYKEDSRLSAYIGIQIAPRIEKTKYINDYVDYDNGNHSSGSYSTTYWDILMGVNGTINYKMGNSWGISGNVSIYANPWLVFDRWAYASLLYRNVNIVGQVGLYQKF